MAPYTAIDLAVLRAMSEMEAAKELIATPRADLSLICQMCHLRIKRGAERIDLVNAILEHTHPKATPAQVPANPAQQLNLF